jgi:hypothetical protein
LACLGMRVGREPPPTTTHSVQALGATTCREALAGQADTVDRHGEHTLGGPSSQRGQHIAHRRPIASPNQHLPTSFPPTHPPHPPCRPVRPPRVSAPPRLPPSACAPCRAGGCTEHGRAAAAVRLHPPAGCAPAPPPPQTAPAAAAAHSEHQGLALLHAIRSSTRQKQW